MLRNRISEILYFPRFAKKSDRHQRLKTGKFVCFSDLLKRFVETCKLCYTPGAFVIVDEQLMLNEQPANVDDHLRSSWRLSLTNKGKYC